VPTRKGDLQIEGRLSVILPNGKTDHVRNGGDSSGTHELVGQAYELLPIALVIRFVRIRHYGLLANRFRKQCLPLAPIHPSEEPPPITSSNQYP
jgi:hypothetical protein